ncbi:MAG TPA: hypothetical protein VH560_12015, partial [Polyangia bacterium]|nr:hypothetical protein [Polyangia bacterium]
MVRAVFFAIVLFTACAASSVAQLPPGTTGEGEPLPPPVAPAPGQAQIAPPPATQPPALQPDA